MKIAIVGDPHIAQGFRARTDDYLHTVLNKIEYIAQENDYIIFLGDLFDASNMSTYIFNETYKVFSKFPNKCHSILGNHDMFHRNLGSLYRTTIGSLFLTQVLQVHTDSFRINGLEFVPVLTNTPIDKIPVDDTNSKILLGHKYFEMWACPEESLEEDDITRLNYRYVFLGHDHMPYDPMKIGPSVLYRPGSLTRTTTDFYNKDRVIRYYQIDLDENAMKNGVEFYTIVEKTIPTLKSEEVYLKGSFDKPVEKAPKVDTSNLKKLLARFDKKSASNISLDQTLRKLGGSDETVFYIRELHLTHNMKYN